MAFERAFIDLNLAVDLDSVEGNFNKAEDFITFIKQTIKNAIPHYNPEVTTKNITLKPYVWNEDKMEYIQPTWDNERKPQVGDAIYSLDFNDAIIVVIVEAESDNDKEFVVVESKTNSMPPTIDTSALVWNESKNRWERT